MEIAYCEVSPKLRRSAGEERKRYMVINTASMREFEAEILRKKPLAWRDAFRIQTWLYKEARSLGRWTGGDWRDDVAVNIKIARAINRSVIKPRT